MTSIPPPADVPLARLAEALTVGVPLTFSRWGDGEWQALLGYAGENCDGHPYSTALREALTGVLEDRPSYLLGLQPLAWRTYAPAITAWLARRALTFTWINADVFHQAAIARRLEPLLAALRQRRILLVGPAYLRPLRCVPHAAFLPVPIQNCFAAYPTVLARAYDLLGAYGPETVVAVSAGMMANVLIHDLYRQFPAYTLLDLGSLWDPFVGRISRTYHRRLVEG